MSPDGRPRIKLAIQKSGRLTDNSLDLLAKCGLPEPEFPFLPEEAPAEEKA